MSRLNDFNRIARYYDALKRLVFGDAIHASEAEFLKGLAPGGKILILGGGSGEILKPLFQVNPGCRVWFVEASSQMLSKAIEMSPAESQANVRFIHGTEESLPADVVFDGIITNFFLDLFSADDIQKICGKLKSKLDKKGSWIVTDFVNDGRLWQRFLLRTMYTFFEWTCRIGTRELCDWQSQLRLAGLEERASKFFYAEFIKSCIYERKDC